MSETDTGKQKKLELIAKLDIDLQLMDMDVKHLQEKLAFFRKHVEAEPALAPKAPEAP